MSEVMRPAARGKLLPVFRWGPPHDPLPVRRLRVPPRSRTRSVGMESPPWLHTGRTDRPFDFCSHVRRLCADLVAHSPELRHIDVSRLLFAVTQARCGRRHGLQARVTPLRFRGGLLTRWTDGVCYRVQRYFVDNVEMLYLITFCLPRFLDQDFDNKLITLFHELYHISPAFDGDLRRYAGPSPLHGRSKEDYDARMADLARGYLSNGADRGLHSFLRLDFAQLNHRHDGVVGVFVPRPRLLPVAERR